MTTRDELIKFLTETYEPDTELIWQTIEYEDLQSVKGATRELWSKFVEHQSYYQHLANDYSENAFNEFWEFVQDNGETTGNCDECGEIHDEPDNAINSIILEEKE
jgi:hypothetical protein